MYETSGQLDSPINESIRRQLSQLHHLSEQIKSRNQTLTEFQQIICDDSTSASDPAELSQDLILLLNENQRQINLTQKRDRLLKMNDHLEKRIQTADQIIERENKQKRNQAIFDLSPTVAELLNIPKPNRNRHQENDSLDEHQKESELFDEQISAISELKNGAIPRQVGQLNFDFEKESTKIDQETDKYSQKYQELISEVAEYMKNTDFLEQEINQRKSDIVCFNQLLSSYYSLINGIEKDLFNEKLDQLGNNLIQEKEMIKMQNSYYGASDFQTAQLKDQIQIQMLYLRHLEAVAGRAFAALSAQPDPSDPIEEMKDENLQMETRLNH